MWWGRKVRRAFQDLQVPVTAIPHKEGTTPPTAATHNEPTMTKSPQ